MWFNIIVLYVEAVKENVVQYHTEGGWFEESDWNNVYGNVKPTTTIFVSMEYMGYVVSDEVPYIVSHNDPNKSETSSFWFNVLAHEEFRQAVASSAIYNRDDLPQFGMQLLEMAELAEMGITTEARLLLARSYPGNFFALWEQPDKPEGFNAGIYYDHITGKAVLTFQGTNPGELADWQANIAQGLGLATDQYNAAMFIGQTLLTLFGSGTNYMPLSASTPSKPTDFMITGHSLGGGLASVATIVTGFSTNTFNAAGLSFTTVLSAHARRLGAGYFLLPDPELLVTPYITENDWLNSGLYLVGLQAFGFDHRYILQDEQWVVLEFEAHSMTQIHYGLMYMYNYNIPQNHQ